MLLASVYKPNNETGYRATQNCTVYVLYKDSKASDYRMGSQDLEEFSL
jgi:hypothetical protein